MRYTIQHPTKPNVKAIYGWDEHLGFWAEVRERGRLVCSLDALTRPSGTTINMVLAVLVKRQLFTNLDIHAAMTLSHLAVEEMYAGRGVKLAAEVIGNLRSAAARG